MTTMNLETIQTEITPIIKGKITITNEEDKAKASQLLSSLTVYLDRLVADREAITKPINESLKAIRAKYKPTETLLDNAISDIRTELSTYQTEQLRLQRIEEDKISKRVKSGSGNLTFESALKKINQLDKPTKEITTKDGSIKFKTVKKFEVIDISKLEIKYLLANEIAIREAMKEGKELSGVRYYEEQIPATYR